VAKSCPQDLVRALVEGTLGAPTSSSGKPRNQIDADERVVEVEAHLASCAACRRLRAELEQEEELLRTAIATFGSRETPANDVPDEGDTCPTEAVLAEFAEDALEGKLRERLEAHVASCGLCRASLVAATAPVMVEVRDEALASARRRLAVARSTPAAAPLARSDSRRSSARRKSGTRTGKYAPITTLPGRSQGGLGILVAAAAGLLVAIGIFAFRDSGEHLEPTVAEADRPSEPQANASKSPVAPVAPRAETPAPLGTTPPEASPAGTPDTTASPATQPSGSEVVAQAKPDDNEEDPGTDEVIEAPHAPRGIGPANSGRTDSTPTDGARGTDTPRRDKPPVFGEKLKGSPTALACAVASLDGSLEIRKRNNAWRALASTDTVDDGDLLRAKGVASGFTFVGHAAVRLDADTVGRVSFESKSVALAIESGAVESETLVRYGLKVSDPNGVVTAWQGSKARVESLADGLHVVVTQGKVRVENGLGHCIVSAGHEVRVTKDRPPSVSPSSHDNDRRTSTPHR
jgi:hypothetical protein